LIREISSSFCERTTGNLKNKEKYYGNMAKYLIFVVTWPKE